MKTLYFEGAGMNFENESSNVGNYRIRTVFLNNNDQKVYLEISGHEFTEKKRKKIIKEWRSFIDHAFYIPSDNTEKDYLRLENTMKGYTKDEIIKFVNTNLNCNFENMEVLSYFEGYHVHGNNRSYNLMDNHKVNHARTQAREKTYNDIDQYFRNVLKDKYSTISLFEMNDNNLVIRCHACKEKLQLAGLTDQDRLKVIEVNY